MEMSLDWGLGHHLELGGALVLGKELQDELDWSLAITWSSSSNGQGDMDMSLDSCLGTSLGGALVMGKELGDEFGLALGLGLGLGLGLAVLGG